MARIAANEAGASAGSGGAGAEVHQKQNSKSFSAASTALTGMTREQLLRTEQDTRALCGVVYDTDIVPSQLSAVISAKAQTEACNEAVSQQGRPFIWTWTGLNQEPAHHGRGAAGRDAATAFGSLGRAQQIVDRGQVQDGATLSASAVQSHARRRGAVSAFGFGKVVGSSAGREESTDRVVERHWHESSKNGWKPRSEGCNFGASDGAGDLVVSGRK